MILLLDATVLKIPSLPLMPLIFSKVLLILTLLMMLMGTTWIIPLMMC